MNRAVVLALQATEAGGIDSLESIPGLHKSFKILPLKSSEPQAHPRFRVTILIGPGHLLHSLNHHKWHKWFYAPLVRLSH
jgi:hypothetical protein